MKALGERRRVAVPTIGHCGRENKVPATYLDHGFQVSVGNDAMSNLAAHRVGHPSGRVPT
jgi:hypothetical protein